jgi:hypothetical protein
LFGANDNNNEISTPHVNIADKPTIIKITSIKKQQIGTPLNLANITITAHHKDTSDNFSVYSVSPLFRYKVQAQIIDDHNIKFFVIFDWSFECNTSNLQ